MPHHQVIKIRQADQSDAVEIARIVVEAWRSAYRGIVDDDTLDGLDVSERAGRWRSRLSDSEWPAYVAVLDRRLKGFVRIEKARGRDIQDEGVGEVGAIYVEPAAWGQGIGRELLSRAHTALVEKDFSEVILWVFEANYPARAFYEKNGYFLDTGRKIHPAYGIMEVRYRSRLLPE